MKNDFSAAENLNRPFQNLLKRKRKSVHYRQNMAKFLITSANNDHKQISKLLQRWIEEKQEGANDKPR